MCGVLAVIGKRGPLDLHHCSGALEGLRLRGPDFSFEELVPYSEIVVLDCSTHLPMFLGKVSNG